MRGSYFNKWLSDLTDESVPCDKLGLITLSYLYRRHTLVYTTNKLWSTIESNEPLTLLNLLNECTVRLISLGDLQFGILRPKPKPVLVITKPHTRTITLRLHYL